MQMVEEKMELIKLAYEKSTLLDRPDNQIAEDILIQIRTTFIELLNLANQLPLHNQIWYKTALYF